MDEVAIEAGSNPNDHVLENSYPENMVGPVAAVDPGNNPNDCEDLDSAIEENIIAAVRFSLFLSLNMRQLSFDIFTRSQNSGKRKCHSQIRDVRNECGFFLSISKTSSRS